MKKSFLMAMALVIGLASFANHGSKKAKPVAKPLPGICTKPCPKPCPAACSRATCAYNK